LYTKSAISELPKTSVSELGGGGNVARPGRRAAAGVGAGVGVDAGLGAGVGAGVGAGCERDGSTTDW